MNEVEKSKERKDAEEAGHVGKAFQNDQFLTQKYKDNAERTRKRLARLRAKKAKGEQ